MKCKIDGCGRDAMYLGQRVCQKHYFRNMRTGSYELSHRPRKYRLSNPAGYQKIHEPDHPLVNKDGYVYEHRFVVYQQYGGILPDCQLCGKPTDWESCHIDHIDCDVTNNSESNLRPVCRWCNTSRGRKDEHEYGRSMAICFDGKTDTPTGWSRDERVNVSGATIRNRKHSGMSDYDALFAPKITHK